MPKKNSPGGCKCCGCNGAGHICVTVRSSCTGNPVVDGATVTVKQGTTVIGTCVTNSSGVCCVDIPAAGSYTVSAAGPCDTASTTVTATCTTVPVTLTVTGITLNVTFTATTCGGHPSSGTASLSGHGVSLTASISAGGVAPFCVPALGDYTLSISGQACFADKTTTVTATGCPTNVTVNLDPKTYSFTAHVQGCPGVLFPKPLPGVTVTVSGAAGSGSATTNGSGQATISGLKAGCTFSVSYSKARWDSQTVGYTMPCGDYIFPTTISMVPAAGYQCWCNCDDPVLDPLTITDGQGTHTVLPGGSTACITKSGVTVSCIDANGDCATTYTASVGYFYSVFCAENGTMTLRRVMPAGPTYASNPNFLCPVESFCSGGAVNTPSTRPAACPVGQNGGLSNRLAAEDVTVAQSTCNPLSESFSFTFGFADSATVNG